MKGMGEMLPRTITNEIHPEKIARDFEPLMRTLARYDVPIQIPTAGRSSWGDSTMAIRSQ